jgi:hypothetical protein
MAAKQKHDRRSFVKSILTGATAAGIITPLATSAKPHEEKPVNKIKMLTSDGKLVEVDESVVRKAAGSRKATNEEIFKWMDPKHKV